MKNIKHKETKIIIRVDNDTALAAVHFSDHYHFVSKQAKRHVDNRIIKRLKRLQRRKK